MSSDSAGEGDEEPFRYGDQLDGTHHSVSNGKHSSSVHSIPSGTEHKPTPHGGNELKTGQQKRLATNGSGASWFSLPAPLKRLFDRFPLQTYAVDELPIRVRGRRDGNVLYIFTSEKDALAGLPSFNPSCLKWQTCLKMCGISFKTAASNNHASPSGSLPFLLSTSQGSHVSDVVPSNRLKRWSKEKAANYVREPSDVRSEIYTSLLENCIRKAWLYQLYLHPANEAVVRRLYVNSSSSNPLVQLTVLSQLRSAAQLEIVKSSTSSGSKQFIDESKIMRDAEDAFEALSSLLGHATWFFSNDSDQPNRVLSTQDGPSLFDASVFAYTHLILDDSGETDGGAMKWNENSLRSILERYENLLRHRERILDMYY